MTNEISVRYFAKTILAGLTLALSASFLTPMVSTSLIPSAQAAGCGDASDFGCDSSGGTAPGPGPVGTTPPVQGGGGGSNNTGTVRPNLDWRVVRGPDTAGGSLRCVRDDGKAALSVDYYYKRVTALGESATVGPNLPGTWKFSSYFPGYGYYWDTFAYNHRVCLYPPRTYTTTAICVIKSFGSVDKVLPSRKNLDTDTAYSDYSRGAPNDYNACVSSNSWARPSAPIGEWGIYHSTAVTTVRTATVEVAYTQNEETGVTPPRKIIDLSAPYELSPKTATASSDCAVPFATPARPVLDFTEGPCSEENSRNPSFRCVAPPVQFDQSDGVGSRVGSNASNSMQFMRDGDPKFLRFNQSVTGSGITVNGYKTTFLRSGTPWSSSKLYNNNFFELSRTDGGSTILSREGGSKSPTYSGRVNEVFHRGFSAGESGAPTLLSQKIDWSGTRTVTTATITGIDGRTGNMTWVASTAQVPTSGSCTQTATMEYIRAIGDAVR